MQILDEWHSEDEYTVKNGDNSNNNLTTYSPHVLRPEPSKRETRAILPKQPLGPEQLTIDQLETSKTSESTQKPINEVSNSSVTKNGSTMVTAKMNNSMRTNAQRTLIKQGEDILHRLRQEHIHYIDKIEQSGIIWVPFSSAIKENFENIVSSCGYRFSFEPRGSLSTENKAAWRIMVT
jgi:hypothetical protein